MVWWLAGSWEETASPIRTMMNDAISSSVAVSFGSRGLKRITPSRSRRAPTTITSPSTSSALTRIEPRIAVSATIFCAGVEREDDHEELGQVAERRLHEAGDRRGRSAAPPARWRTTRSTPAPRAPPSPARTPAPGDPAGVAGDSGERGGDRDPAEDRDLDAGQALQRARHHCVAAPRPALIPRARTRRSRCRAATCRIDLVLGGVGILRCRSSRAAAGLELEDLQHVDQVDARRQREQPRSPPSAPRPARAVVVRRPWS